jgi:hypothetical protein
MTQTTHLALPLIDAAQAQKHVTHNEALAMLDALAHLAVTQRNVTSPPATPVEGDRLLVGAGAAGVFAGKEKQIATFLAGDWTFLAPRPGWRVFVAAESLFLLYTGAAWVDLGAMLRELQNLARLGVGTTADAANPFAAKVNGALFTAKPVAQGGTGDLRLFLNKEASANTAAHIFQTNYSARAEIGLTGDDNLSLDVSPDGASFIRAMIADRTDGTIRFPKGIREPNTNVIVPQLVPAPTADIWRSDVARASTPRNYNIASVSGATINLTTASVAEIFSAYMRSASMVRIWNVSKTPAQSAWVNWDNSSTQLNVTNAAHIATWTAGEAIRLGDPNPTGSNALQMIAIDISDYMQAKFGAVFRQKGLLISCSAGAIGGAQSLAMSGSGAVGTAFGNASNADGSLQSAMFSVFTDQLSPISNSNLLFVREQLGTGSAVGTSFLRLVGLYI